jgi:hypothetical protein
MEEENIESLLYAAVVDWTALSNEMWLAIMDYLPLHGIRAVRQTCSRLNSWPDEKWFWLRALQHLRQVLDKGEEKGQSHLGPEEGKAQRLTSLFGAFGELINLRMLPSQLVKAAFRFLANKSNQQQCAVELFLDRHLLPWDSLMQSHAMCDFWFKMMGNQPCYVDTILPFSWQPRNWVVCVAFFVIDDFLLGEIPSIRLCWQKERDRNLKTTKKSNTLLMEHSVRNLRDVVRKERNNIQDAVNVVAASLLQRLDVIHDFGQLVKIMDKVTKVFMDTYVHPDIFVNGLDTFQLPERGGCFVNKVEERMDVIPWKVFEEWLKTQLQSGNGDGIVGFEWIARLMEMDCKDFISERKHLSLEAQQQVVLEAHRPKVRLWELQQRNDRMQLLRLFLEGKLSVLDKPWWPLLGWCLSFWDKEIDVKKDEDVLEALLIDSEEEEEEVDDDEDEDEDEDEGCEGLKEEDDDDEDEDSSNT